MAKKRSNFRKSFRKNKRIDHPTYIVDEVDGKYKYIGLTHSEKVNGVTYIKLSKNPDPDDSRTAYLAPEPELDIPKNFGRSKKGWKFDKKDKKVVDEVSKKPPKNKKK